MVRITKFERLKVPFNTIMEKKEVRRKFSFLITVLAGASVPFLLKQLKNHSQDIKYAGRVAGTILVSCILEPFRWWENLRWKRRIKRTTINKPPIFIIGFWRSGTTLLHNLLSQKQDGAYITTYQTVFPDLLLSHSWWFKPIIGQFWPTHRPFDDVKMGMDLPQEEEIAMSVLHPVSFYNFLYFPKDFEPFYLRELFMKDLEPELRESWKSVYIRMIKKAFINTGGDHFISKSPSNMARIGLILEMFPDARFIFIYRDPYKTNESIYRFFHEVLPAVQLQDATDLLTREKMARVYSDMVRQYRVEKSRIKEENLMEIKFEDFRINPVEYLKKIYDQFHIPGFEQDLPAFEKYLEDVSEFRTNKYEVTEETIRYVNQYAPDIVEWLGYPGRS
jgi:hypothetical protein